MNTTSDFDSTSSRQGSEQPNNPLTRPHPEIRPSPSASAYFYSSATASIHDPINADNSHPYTLTSSYTHESAFCDERPTETGGMSRQEFTTVVEPYHSRGSHHSLTQSQGFPKQLFHSQPHLYQPSHQQPLQELLYHDQLHHHRLYNHPSSHTRQTKDDDDENDNDDDDDDDPDFVGTIDEAADSQEQLHPLPSRSLARPSRPLSSYELHSNNFISHDEFRMLTDDYLMSLSPKKREKALLSNSMYQKILMVLLQPKNTQVSTAQFRFWAKKMFTMSTTETHHVVCHAGKPVATKECLYDVLVYCHRKSSHGGRDKTSAEVRLHYSWVPKELIARFVKHCPLCSSRRLSLQRPLSLTALSSMGYGVSSSSAEFSSQMELSRFQDSDATFHGRQSHLGNHLEMRDPERVDSSTSNPPHVYQPDPQQAHQRHRQQPQNQLYWSAPQAFLQQHHGARLHAEHMYRLQQQRAQRDLIGRSCPDLQYEQHSQQGGSSTQFLAFGDRQLPSDAQYFGMQAGASSVSDLESNRAHRWSAVAGGHNSLLTDHNEARVEDEGRWYGQHNDLSWNTEGVRSAAHPDHEVDDDRIPSGLVGIPQEVRRFDRRNVSRAPGAQPQFPSQHPQQGSGFQLRPAHYLYEPLHQGHPSDQGSRDPMEGEIQEMEDRVYYDRLSSQSSVLHAPVQAVHLSGYTHSFDPYASHSNAPHDVSALPGPRQPNNDRFRQAPSAVMSGNVPVVSHPHNTRVGAREIRGQGGSSHQSEHEDDELENREMT
ncbi:hypothetical protein KVV02_003485 [Mortierella alpina]|uniref:Integrase zinc-binding domain-containing protein n=1 Tax=Mortierella alpina TaxID=64518 RepID=A0A9P8CZ21_MORAP|nr:hypothetical protein KVV02_003485 [Mortierella alpina]